MTYREMYEWGVRQLEQAEVPEARLDAGLLLEFVCKTDRNALLAHGEDEKTKEELDRYHNLIKRRAGRIPLQHLTHEQEFMGLPFYVDERVLIPRQDTEILVEEALHGLKDGMQILDMCTGSGCILLSLLHYSNECEGVGVDFSTDALEVARQNAQSLGETPVFIHSDLFENVTGKFDLIVSNPPYIATKEIETLMPEVREHEPHMALDGLEDGLFFYRRIVQDAIRHLKSDSRLIFEIGYDQAKIVAKLMTDAGFDAVEIKKDYAGLDRVVTGVWQMFQ